MSAGSGIARAGRAGGIATGLARLAGGLPARAVAGLLGLIGLAGGLGLAGCEAGSTDEQAQAAERAVPAELREACKAVAERLMVLTQESLVRLPDRERALVDSQLGQVRDQYATRCMDEAWSAPVRDCMRAAGSREAFAQCAPTPGR